MSLKRAQAYAKKIVGLPGKDIMLTKDAVGLSFHWVVKEGNLTEYQNPPRVPNVIHIWEDANGIIEKAVVNYKGV